MTDDSYLSTFDARGDLYNEASSINPRAREIERRILIDMLRVEPHHRVCDAPAGGGYLADGLRAVVNDPARIVCVEPSAKFSQAIHPSYERHIAPLNRLPMEDTSIDRVGSLAGLHHLNDKSGFFHESFRVLKPSGILVVADVLEGTAVAGFLNGPVDTHTETGHKGVFLQRGECSGLMKNAGFTGVDEQEKEFFWTFKNEPEMVRYCRTLFGMLKAAEDEVREALHRSFAITVERDAVRLPWSLVYGTGVKPDRDQKS